MQTISPPHEVPGMYIYVYVRVGMPIEERLAFQLYSMLLCVRLVFDGQRQPPPAVYRGGSLYVFVFIYSILQLQYTPAGGRQVCGRTSLLFFLLPTTPRSTQTP